MASVILGSLTAASLILALRANPEPSLKWYCWAQLASLPVLWLANWRWGIWSPWYGGIYVAATLPILWAIRRICWESISEHRYKARALAGPFLISGVLGRLSFLGLTHQANGFDWVNIILGVLLAWAGCLLGFAAPHQKRWGIALILAVLWMSQAVSSFGWVIHLWGEWNWLVDPALGFVAFSLITGLLRSSAKPYLPASDASRT